MILFHTIHTISIRRYSRMDATGDRRLTSRVMLPVFLCQKAYDKLQFGVGLLFDEDILENDIVRAILYNRITLYRSALIVLETSAEAVMLEWYKQTFRQEWNGDSKRLNSELDRMLNRYKEMEKKETPSDRTFEDIIGGVETVLNYAIDRRITIFEFKALYDNAIKKVKT